MAFDLQAGYGAADQAAAIRQMIQDQLAARHQAVTESLAQREMNLREAENQRRAEEFQQSLAERKAAADQAAATHKGTTASTGLAQLGMGGDVTDQQFAQTYRGTPSESLVPPLLTLPSRQIQPTSPTSTESPDTSVPMVGALSMSGSTVPQEQGIHRSLGTAAQQDEARQRAALAAAANDQTLPASTRGVLRMIPDVGKVPGAMEAIAKTLTPTEAKPGELKEDVRGNLIRVAPDNTVTPVTDASGNPQKAYHAPVLPTVINVPGSGPIRVDRQAGTGTAILDSNENPIRALTPQEERLQTLASLAGGDVDEASKQVDAAEKAGLLGPTAGRLNGQFLAGTVGSTGSQDVDRQLGALKQAIANVKLSYPIAAAGGMSRGAGGGGGTQRLDATLNSDKFSADLLRGALDEMRGKMTRTSSAGAKGNVEHWTRDANGHLVKQ